ncbi:hypothetical protein BofuT4_uP031480.1 [Botrytis cinerea T4]|uniref:Uncharacterized protein n=1 Tax=Botryotinia fuckeliana (strain T4) TaxID=999810 RepID=G2Y9J6_BOTF4|nr:hypothetical protein BofuT4_uP031480.1 [Botrytis cinerea T4]
MNIHTPRDSPSPSCGLGLTRPSAQHPPTDLPRHRETQISVPNTAPFLGLDEQKGELSS